jgi:hypothetical protein
MLETIYRFSTYQWPLGGWVNWGHSGQSVIPVSNNGNNIFTIFTTINLTVKLIGYLYSLKYYK